MSDKAQVSEGLAFAEILANEPPNALAAADRDGNVLFWSRGAQAMFQVDSERAVGVVCTI
jgi:PAS domain-containing protein